MDQIFADCTLCPRNCHADRLHGKTGFCGQTAKIRAARAALHMWEEPCISGNTGSGAVFFSGCALGCIYCQNREISRENAGKEISADRLADIFLDLQAQGAWNINLVTAGHFAPQVIRALDRAKTHGLVIPVVYNSSGYESVSTLKMLEGYVDIYLPDFKYPDSETAETYSHAADYPLRAKEALAEMVRQIPRPAFDGEQMKKGVIVRHLVLPGHTENACRVIRYLYETYGDSIYISLLNQYTPPKQFSEFPELSRRVTVREYDRVVDYAISIGVENGFIQEGDTAKDCYIPPFDTTGL